MYFFSKNIHIQLLSDLIDRNILIMTLLLVEKKTVYKVCAKYRYFNT